MTSIPCLESDALASAVLPTIGVAQILRAQRADPARVRPRARALAERALLEGPALLQLETRCHSHRVRRIEPAGVFLDGGERLRHPALASALAGASEVFAVVLTLGPRLDAQLRTLAATAPAYALALDGFGAVLIQRMADEIRACLAREAASHGLNTGTPLSPGMRGWATVPGQSELLRLLHGPPRALTLSSAGMLAPAKSLSFLLGAGSSVRAGAEPCDVCERRPTCRYRAPA